MLKSIITELFNYTSPSCKTWLPVPKKLVLCTLLEGERNVTELTKIVGISQTAMSNHLAKLRSENVVDFTRDQRTLTYRLSTANAEPIIAALYKIYCSGDNVETS